MSEKSRKTFRILLIVLSVCLFLAIAAKLVFSILGGYGSPVFTALDDISDVLFLPWLAALIVYLFSQERKLSGR
jgi:hypothetical protein